MSYSPNLQLLLKQIGTYLAKAEANGSKQKQELNRARAAHNKILGVFYGEVRHNVGCKTQQTQK
jgi:hypothetical protein